MTRFSEKSELSKTSVLLLCCYYNNNKTPECIWNILSNLEISVDFLQLRKQELKVKQSLS